MEKNLLKRSAFVVKSETTKSFTIKGGILVFILPKKLSIDQCAFGAVKRLSNFSAIFFGKVSFAMTIKLEHSVD